MRYLTETVKKNRILILAYTALGIFNSFLMNYKADYFQKIVDGLAGGSLALSGIVFYGILLIVNYLANYADEYPARKLEYGIFLDIKLMALKKISVIDYLEYQRLGTGKLVQRIENGAEAGRDMLCSFWLCLVRELIPTILFSIFFIWRIHRGITCALLAGYVFVFAVTNILLKSLYRIKEKILGGEEKLNHFLVRGFMEMTVFRMAGQFPAELAKAQRARETIVSSKVKMKMIHEAFFTIFALLVAALNIGILLYAWRSRIMSAGEVVALLSLIDNAYTPIAIFNVLYVQYKLDKASFGRFGEFLDLEEDSQLEKGEKIQGIEGRIRIEGLDFQYGEHRIFENFCLSVSPGEKVTLMGESGCGKSTLVRILLGLLKYEKGSVRLDHTELKDICLNDLYNHIAYVSQDAPVFDGTIRENLVFDRRVPDEQLLKAIRKAGLSRLLENSPHGLETRIGERGASLSGGEKQRLALARLLLLAPRLVILDEATSAMNEDMEEAVMGEILRELEESTVIAVTHTVSTCIGFDRVIDLGRGLQGSS